MNRSSNIAWFILNVAGWTLIGFGVYRVAFVCFVISVLVVYMDGKWDWDNWHDDDRCDDDYVDMTK